jgi:hypothetical protein
MFIDVVPNGRSALAVLLRESYREASFTSDIKTIDCSQEGIPEPGTGRWDTRGRRALW